MYARLSRWFAGCASALVSALALAQAPVEVSFYYPVAVGGPITKIIDGYAAAFEKDNPGIKLRPIYSGSYQESIAKALTAVKAGDPPVLSILLVSFGGWHLGMRNVMINLLNEDFVILARAKGLSENRIKYRYVARNAILPQITALALSIGFLLGGALVTEQVFNYPGLGKFTFSAIGSRDYSFIQGQLLLLTASVLVANLLSDIANVILDPRLRSR